MLFSGKQRIAAFMLAGILLTGCASQAVPAETAASTEYPTQTLPPETAAVTEATETTAATQPPALLDAQTRYGRQCYDTGEYLYPAELGSPVLGQEAMAELAATAEPDEAAMVITNIGDAFYYLQARGPEEYGRVTCERFAQLIGEDYEAAGIMAFDFDDNYACLVHVKQDGIYYAFDPCHPNDHWILLEENRCAESDNLEDLSEKLLAVLTSEGSQLVSKEIVEDITTAHGAKVFFYAGTSFPVGLGYPTLSDSQIDTLIAEKDYAKTAETITTLADAVNYYFRMGLTLTRNVRNVSYGFLGYSQSAWQALDRNRHEWTSMCSLTHYLLEGDYDEVGYVHLGSDSGSHVMVYIYEDGLYYLLNPADYMYGAEIAGWLSHHPAQLIACAEDFQIIADSIVEHYGIPDQIKEVHLVRSHGDYVSGVAYDMPAFPEGTEVIEYYGDGFVYERAFLDWQSQTRMEDLPENDHGAETFSHAGTTIPVALGQPQLSDMEIRNLIREKDYAKAAETITTLADLVKYLKIKEFSYEREKTFAFARGNFTYYESAWQVLENNTGGCSPMSSLALYFLRGDYDDIGYVSIRSAGDGHTMIYIYEDGLYYLINPTDYCINTNDPVWLGSYYPGLIGCAEDFQTIADSIVQYIRLEYDHPIDKVYTIRSPGDFVAGAQGNLQCYPEGTEVTEYYGPGFTFAAATACDWQSQTRMDG